jgi:NADH-quinone oxidoreductase subunit I
MPETILSFTVFILNAARSLFSACFTILPYLFKFGDRRKEITESYPDPIASRTPEDLPAKSRGLLFNDIDRCIGCFACQEICPSQCIQIEAQQAVNQLKVWVSVFDIDFSQCIFCGLCVEVCVPNSLIHTKQFEAAAFRMEDLIANFGRGTVSPEQQEKWALQSQNRRGPLTTSDSASYESLRQLE